MEKSYDHLGPGHDSWEDRLGPDDGEWLRTRVERWFERYGERVVAAVAVAVLAPVWVLFRTHRLDHVLGLDGPIPLVATPASEHWLPPDLEGDLPLDREHPFEGTAEAGWADGEAGVVVPAVEESQTAFAPAERLAAAMDQVRQVVVASRLDPRVLRDGDVEPLLGLFAVGQREELRARLASPDGGAVATRVAAGERLLDVPPKVSGQMLASATGEDEVVVRTSFSFAYAFDTDRGLRSADSAVARATHRVTYAVRGDGVHLVESSGNYVDGSCDGADPARIAPPVSAALGVPCVR
ncbi:hypothetical protein AB0425_18575 [Actinosynnema sp. NPDC051121]